jgi:hypothetical protein
MSQCTKLNRALGVYLNNFTPLIDLFIWIEKYRNVYNRNEMVLILNYN